MNGVKGRKDYAPAWATGTAEGICGGRIWAAERDVAKKKCWLGNTVGAAGGKQWMSGRRRDPDSTETGGFSGRLAEGWRAQVVRLSGRDSGWVEVQAGVAESLVVGWPIEGVEGASESWRSCETGSWDGGPQ